MKNKVECLLGKSVTIYVILTLIIIAQLVCLSCNFVFYKDGYHSDEIFSYGLSNSYHNPFLVCDSSIYDTNSSVFNIHEWVSGDVFQNYITVDADKTFNYENVWYNQSLDRHPPLYYAVLHTVCSFFPEQFTAWFGFGVNLATFAVLQIFLFLLARKILKSNMLALLTVLCYGFSIGAVSTFVYIRMYTMAAMWIVILAYFHARLLEYNESLKIKNLIPLAVTVMLGALTEHEFTIMAFVFAVCFCLYYLFKKQFKNFFKYGCSMLLGVLLAWVIFTPLMFQIFAESSGNVAVVVGFEDFIRQFKLAIYYPLNALFGINRPTSGAWIFLGIVIPTIAGVIITFALPICFLFRKSKRFLTFKEKAKHIIPNFINYLKTWRPKKIIQGLSRINILCLSMLAAALAIIATASRTTIFWLMSWCDRYVFITYPFVLLIVISLVYWFIRKIKTDVFIKGGKWLVVGMFVCLLGYNVSTVRSDYFFEGTHNIGDLSEITANSDCIVVDDIAWRMECFAIELRNVDHVFYAVSDYLDKVWEEMNAFETSKPVYLLWLIDNEGEDGEIGSSEKKNIEKYIIPLNFCSKTERMGVVTIYSHNYAVYRLN